MKNNESTLQLIAAIIILFIVGYFAFESYIDLSLRRMVRNDLQQTLELEKPVSNSWGQYKWTTSYSENEYEKVASVSEPIEMEIKDVNVSRHIGNSAAKMSKELVKGMFDGLLRSEKQR